jgi:dTDP-4-amino-4,6-dideoxygalactose transaminase
MDREGKKIYVTRPSLPPLDRFVEKLEDLWESRWLTNNGKFHQEFEKALSKYLCVPYCSLVSNGTLGLIIALQALRITGEVITTPYSFVATTHALHWNGIRPVFCDIEEKSLSIDPSKIEALITPKTTAILPVHVYGYPSDVNAISQIADTYGLKVIYDAAHAFGVTVNGTPIVQNGDMSILSFHATKVFNTIEGGAIIMNDEKMKIQIDFLKNFGFANETTVVAPGINAKMNELQAALGILQLEYIEKALQKNKDITEYYRINLNSIDGIFCFQDFYGVKHNYSYFPILVDAKEYGMDRDELYEKFKEKNIFVRRYFYPLISNFPTYRGLPSSTPENLPIAEKISKQILCLPIYEGLELRDVDRICEIIKHG